MGRKVGVTVSIIVLIFIIGVWIFVNTYQTAREQYTVGHDQSKELALNSGNLTSIEDIKTFNSDKKYHIMTAKNSDNESVYVWVYTEKKKNTVFVKKQSSGISKDDAVKMVLQDYNPEEIISTQLGMDEGIPIWEVKYKDKSGRYTLDYVNFYDGEIIKHMALMS